MGKNERNEQKQGIKKYVAKITIIQFILIVFRDF